MYYIIFQNIYSIFSFFDDKWFRALQDDPDEYRRNSRTSAQKLINLKPMYFNQIYNIYIDIFRGPCFCLRWVQRAVQSSESWVSSRTIDLESLVAESYQYRSLMLDAWRLILLARNHDHDISMRGIEMASKLGWNHNYYTGKYPEDWLVSNVLMRS